MLKFAFIENVPGTTPESYCAVYDNAESHSMVVGTSSFEMTRDLIEQLDQEGFDIVDLCGDFTDEDVERFLQVVKSDMTVKHADYFPAELQKLEALDSLAEYGIIVMMDGVEVTPKLEIKDKECNSYIRFTKDMDAAKAAARELMEQGVAFIELCSYFDKEKTEAIIEAVSGKIPVGSCGI